MLKIHTKAVDVSTDIEGEVLTFYCLVGRWEGKWVTWGKDLPTGDWGIGGNYESSFGDQSLLWSLSKHYLEIV